MRTLEERVKRLEYNFSRFRSEAYEPVKKRISEKEACARYGIQKARLKQLRLGHMGKPPVLKKWTSVNGRRFEYDVAELDKHFKKIIPDFSEVE